jgi:hypothetical protein
VPKVPKSRRAVSAERADERGRGETDREFNLVRVRERGKHQTKQVTIGGFRFTETSRRERIQNDIECAKEEKTKGTVGTDATIGAGEVAKRKLQL